MTSHFKRISLAAMLEIKEMNEGTNERTNHTVSY